jgi:hypothetical protein
MSENSTTLYGVATVKTCDVTQFVHKEVPVFAVM